MSKNLDPQFFDKMRADMAGMLVPDPKLAIAQPGEINPKLIYIAESDHADAAYGSLAEQLIKEHRELGLEVQTFSEFSSQAEKIRTQGELKNKTDEESFKATSDFLSPPILTEMGSLQERENAKDRIFEKLKGLRPSELKELDLDQYIDSPELRKLFAEELEEKIENGDERLENKRDFLWWIGGFYAAATHAKMANDVRQSLNPETDVVIIIAGSPHIPCLGALLEDDFPNSETFVITKPSGQILFPLVLSDSTPEALSAVGEVVGFEINEENKALLPSRLFASRLGSEINPERIQAQSLAKKLVENAISTATESWVKKISAQKNSSEIIR
ncbi:MAG: hypothetical protein KGP29_02060 [Proteobacteria bacterium]|nr:hypothetical protein [Pseudomonadota bacterium]